MLTPHEIQERKESLEKAVFGGYNKSSVNDLLATLTENYTSLLQENTSLKSKLKSMTDRVEELHNNEENINRTLMTAQKTADDLISETERKCTKMINDTESRLRKRSEDLQKEVAAESTRVDLAKESAAKFIVELENQVQAQLAQLEHIKQMNLTTGETAETVPLEAAPAEPAPAVKPATTTARSPLLQKASAKLKTDTPMPKPQEKPQEKPQKKSSEKQSKSEREMDTMDLTRQLEDDIRNVLAQANSIPETSLDLGETRVMNPI